MQRLLTRLANIEFIYEQLNHLKIRFFSLSHPQIEDTEFGFKTAHDLIHDTSNVRLKYEI